MKKSVFIILTLATTSMSMDAQILRPVHWSYGFKRTGEKEAVVFIKATIDDSWHIYSTAQKDGGPVKTSFTFVPSQEFDLLGIVNEPKPVTKFEKVFGMDVSYFENSVTFQQKIKWKATTAIMVKGALKFMVCNDQKCLPPETIGFEIPVK